MLEALKYKTRNEFRILGAGAYSKCRTSGWIDDACAHMASGFKRIDGVYIWKCKGFLFNGVQVYKIGIARMSLVKRRASIVASCNGLEIEEIKSFKTSKAQLVESIALKIGSKVEMKKS